jgi:hypothetical protein
MSEDNLLDKLYETFPTVNKRCILTFYLNVVLVLEEGRPCYRVDICVTDSKTTYDFINIVTNMYPDTFEVFKSKIPFLFLKKNAEFITSILENMTHENVGKALGYRYTNSDALDKKNIRLGLSIMFNQVGHKTKTQLYGFCVPTKSLDETIMDNIYNDIQNYNNILNKYGYNVSLRSDILWMKDDKILRNSKLNK